jgi:hypothetical protein
MLSQSLPDFKPYNKYKPKKKYEYWIILVVIKFIGIRSQIEIYNEDGKGYAYIVLS